MTTQSTGEAIIAFCKECVNSNATKDRQNCGGEYVLATKKPCALFPLRIKGRGNIKLIRKNCIECSGSIYQVEECTTETCPLYEFRMGKNPNMKNRPRPTFGFQKGGGIGRVSKS